MASSSSSRIGEASGPKHTEIGEASGTKHTEIGEASGTKKEKMDCPEQPSEVKEKLFTSFQLGNYDESIEHFKNLNDMDNPRKLGPGDAEDDSDAVKAMWNLIAEEIEEIARTYLRTEDQAKRKEKMMGKTVAEKTVDTSWDYESLEHLISKKVPRSELETLEIAYLTICMGRLALENKNIEAAHEKFEKAKELLTQVSQDQASHWRCFDSINNTIFQIGTSIWDHTKDVLLRSGGKCLILCIIIWLMRSGPDLSPAGTMGHKS